jgi:hypothetical protein
MNTLSFQTIQKYRNKTYLLIPGQQLKDINSAVNFVKERGFVHFWPIKGVELPSLWTAVAGPRPVADAHDDPGHITWGWKDDSLGKKIWYYGKILRKKATMIDLAITPYFYALSKNYGDPVDDVQIQYEEGKLTLEAKSIFNAVHQNGPMDTVAIRRATNMTNKESNSRFDRAIIALQTDFKILPVGISDAGGWRYAFIYDLVHRYYPELPEESRYINERDARCKLLKTYFKSVGAAQLRDVLKIFQWKVDQTQQTLDFLANKNELISNLKIKSEQGEWFSTPDLFEGD